MVHSDVLFLTQSFRQKRSMNMAMPYPDGDITLPHVSDIQLLNAPLENTHFFVIEFHVTNNNFLLLLSFIYYTALFPLDKKEFWRIFKHSGRKTLTKPQTQS